MQDVFQPLIHKAAVHEIAVNIARAGLSIGDEAELHALPDGRIGVFARLSRRLLGLIPRQVTVHIGTLGPQARAFLSPAVEGGESLRVRIVGLTPEHLTVEGGRPEIHISVWGNPRHLAAQPFDTAAPAETTAPPAIEQPAPPEGGLAQNSR